MRYGPCFICIVAYGGIISRLNRFLFDPDGTVKVPEFETIEWCHQAADKYLIAYDYGVYPLQHKLSNLQAMMKDAVSMGRTLIIDEAKLDPKHNGNRDSSPKWTKYIDLETNIVCARWQEGCCRVRVEERSALPPKTAIHNIGCEIGNHNYKKDEKALTRDCPLGAYGLVRLAVKFEDDAAGGVVFTTGSAPVMSIAEKIVDKLGEDSWFAHLRHEKYKCAKGSRAPTGYAAVEMDVLLPIFREHVPPGSKVFVGRPDPHVKLSKEFRTLYNVTTDTDVACQAKEVFFPDPVDLYFNYAVDRVVRGYFKMKGRTIAVERAPGRSLGPVGIKYEDLTADVNICPDETVHIEKPTVGALLRKVMAPSPSDISPAVGIVQDWMAGEPTHMVLN